MAVLWVREESWPARGGRTGGVAAVSLPNGDRASGACGSTTRSHEYTFASLMVSSRGMGENTTHRVASGMPRAPTTIAG